MSTIYQKPYVQIANSLISNFKIKYYNGELYVYNNGLYTNDISILEREILKIHPYLAPYKVAVLPLNKKYHGEKAKELFEQFNKSFMTTYDETASIGKRYRRQDAIGTPFCITVDDETINNGTVTVRDRDTMEQIRIKIEDVKSYIEEKLVF